MRTNIEINIASDNFPYSFEDEVQIVNIWHTVITLGNIYQMFNILPY